ncbi:MAG: HAD family hydrolase [Candidatus Eisenbacteria bacterium]|uniref:HAD family hydrolase n=1 Tax=Eiseniibacteriota bacterium TaxID=2212470 RepID=A0A538SGN5_UNCEI|nr:MAG: HAD family hydrolase [Candidatus Eisenbacteria bacterium]
MHAASAVSRSRWPPAPTGSSSRETCARSACPQRPSTLWSPDPQIFVLASERLGLPPRRCLVIEDAPNGLRAGKAAGCHCLGITTTFGADELRAAGADLTAPDLSAVPPEIVRERRLPLTGAPRAS